MDSTETSKGANPSDDEILARIACMEIINPAEAQRLYERGLLLKSELAAYLRRWSQNNIPDELREFFEEEFAGSEEALRHLAEH